MGGWVRILLALVIVLGVVGAQAQAPRGIYPGSGADDDELAAMQAERRVALVIGNGSYPDSIGWLPNPLNDARAMAETLEELGFEVTLLLDATREEIQRALLPFERALRGGGVGLFYFSGHGVQVSGRNFLIPIDAELDLPPDVGLETADYVALETVEIDQVLGRIGIARNRVNIVILDACRNNPFASSVRGITRGLAQTSAPRGTLVAYSTAPNQVALDGEPGGNSFYTAALLDVLREPGLPLESAFKLVRERVMSETRGFQVPWENSSLIGDFYFRLPEPEIVEREPDLPPERPAVAAPGIDLAVWDTIKDSQIAGDFQLFVDTYPDSPFAPFARLRLEALRDVEIAAVRPDAEAAAAMPEPEPTLPALPEREATLPALPEPEPTVPAPATPIAVPAPAATTPVPGPESVETALALSAEERREVQEALTALGFDTRGIDGIFGANTRQAIDRWQQASGQEPTGYLTSLQYGKLLAEVEPKVALLEAVRPEPEPPSPVQPAVGLYDPPRKPGEVFRDCDVCPEMVVIPAGSFTMGSPQNEEGRRDNEGPQRRVTITEQFAIGKYEVTFDEWDACYAGGGCNGYRPQVYWLVRGRLPVVNVSWNDAQAYVSWLKEKTGEAYRLPSEAEWDYAARAGTTTRYSWGNDIRPENANYSLKGPGWVGSYRANPWGLHDMHGNVSEWVEDCWNDSYRVAPEDGSAWVTGNCSRRVVRGGSWSSRPISLRSAGRSWDWRVSRVNFLGFRVARTLTP
jgi:formylglycine-generating enzyme required for sulfatase activity